MNTGIGDAVDLGWKLAAVLDGWGGDHLLSSYDAERRPVGNRNVNLTTEFYLEHEKFGDRFATIEENSATGANERESIGEALVRRVGRMFCTTGLQLGYRYEDSPICLSDGSASPADDPEIYVPSARPGSRAPHVWLGENRSIIDLFGQGFVLLNFDANSPDVFGVEMAALKRGVPLKAITINEPYAAELYERRLALVRPDGHIAWRDDNMPADPGFVIDAVRGAFARREFAAGCAQAH